MGEIYKIERENKQMDELLKCLSDNRANIKEIICILRHRNGDVNLLDNATFETKCAGSKLLDFMLNDELAKDNTEDLDYDETLEGEEEDDEES